MAYFSASYSIDLHAPQVLQVRANCDAEEKPSTNDQTPSMIFLALYKSDNFRGLTELKRSQVLTVICDCHLSILRTNYSRIVRAFKSSASYQLQSIRGFFQRSLAQPIHEAVSSMKGRLA